jgi:hypothetical protein
MPYCAGMSTGDVITASGFGVAAVAALLAYRQLREAKKIANGQLILAIDQLLWSFEELRRQINSKKLSVKRQVDKIQLRRYIAALERVGLLLRQESLDPASVESCYGARLKHLINSTDPEPDYVVMILTETEADEQGWDDFLWLWGNLQKLLELRDVPSRISETRD